MRKWQLVLAPYADLFLSMCQLIVDTDDDSLRKLVRACDKPTTTNCSWHIYRIAPLVQQAAREEIVSRIYAKREAKKEWA